MDADARRVETGYDWTVLAPSEQVVDPDGLALTSSSSYDSAGDVQKVTAEGGKGSSTTPATTNYIYYTASGNAMYAECGGHAEWAGLVCRTEPGGSPSTGPKLVHSIATYDYYGNLRTLTERNADGVQRKREIIYDAAGRPGESRLTAAAGLGRPVETRRNVYDPVTGQLLRNQTVDGSGAVTAEIIRTFDSMGRQVSYQDADGNRSTETYDAFGRLAASEDGKGRRVYHYDEGTERRGLLTSVDDEQGGRFTGGYDIDGNLVSQAWPIGIRVDTTFDEVGSSVALSYTRTECGTQDCTLFAESVTESGAGQ